MFNTAAEQRIPVVLLTGFLGAGKTTMLNFLLRHPEMTGTAVVINEFGDVGLDHHLIISAEPDEIELIEGGCMCCTARGQVAEALMLLFEKAQRKQIPSLKRIVIETTGLAEPGPILKQLHRSHALGERFVIDSVVTLVDASNMVMTLDRIAIAQQQITAADALLITKSDLIDAESLDKAVARLKEINPDASVEVITKGAARPEQLFANRQSRRSGAGFRISPLLATADARTSSALSPMLDDDRPVPGPSDIVTFSLVIERPLPVGAFFVWLDLIREFAGPDLLRVKGIVNFESQRLPRVVHGVQGFIHPLESIPDWPSDDRRTRLVFITRSHASEGIRASFRYLVEPFEHADQGQSTSVAGPAP